MYSVDMKKEVQTNQVFHKTIGKIRDPRLISLLLTLNRITAPILDATFAVKTCCIGATRIMTGILNHYDYEAEILPVSCMIWNKRLFKYVQKIMEEHNMDSLNDFWKWAKENRKQYDESGSHMVTIGEAGPGNVGHYVTYIPQHNLILDPTISQGNRPHKEIDLSTIILSDLPDGFMEKRPLIFNVKGCMITYVKENHDAFMTSEDWLDRDGFIADTTKQAIEVIDAIQHRY